MFDFDSLEREERVCEAEARKKKASVVRRSIAWKLSAPTYRREVHVCTYNVLAPCYFRDGQGGVEADGPFWQARFEAQVAAVFTAADPDILCLQEFWFVPYLQELLGDVAKSRGYELFFCRRTGWALKEDGLAVLVRNSRLQVVEAEEQELCKEGSRVLLKLLLELKEPGRRTQPTSFVLGCTHLTHPHGEHTNRMRMVQAFHASRSCFNFARKHGLDPASAALVLVGDMNAKAGAEEDLALQTFAGDSWRSAFAEVHGHEAGATHRTHRDELVCADFILLYGGLRATSAAVLPLADDSDAAIARAMVGRAAGLSGEPPPASLADWAQLSDHRPVLAAVRLGAAAPVGAKAVPDGLRGS